MQGRTKKIPGPLLPPGVSRPSLKNVEIFIYLIYLNIYFKRGQYWLINRYLFIWIFIFSWPSLANKNYLFNFLYIYFQPDKCKDKWSGCQLPPSQLQTLDLIWTPTQKSAVTIHKNGVMKVLNARRTPDPMIWSVLPTRYFRALHQHQKGTAPENKQFIISFTWQWCSLRGRNIILLNSCIFAPRLASLKC